MLPGPHLQGHQRTSYSNKDINVPAKVVKKQKSHRFTIAMENMRQNKRKQTEKLVDIDDPAIKRLEDALNSLSVGGTSMQDDDKVDEKELKL